MIIAVNGSQNICNDKSCDVINELIEFDNEFLKHESKEETYEKFIKQIIYERIHFLLIFLNA